MSEKEFILVEDLGKLMKSVYDHEKILEYFCKVHKIGINNCDCKEQKITPLLYATNSLGFFIYHCLICQKKYGTSRVILSEYTRAQLLKLDEEK